MPLRRLTAPVLLALCLLGASLSCGAAQTQGRVEQIKVMGESLQGNLEGDDPNRTVYVYLPPGYDKSRQRYPVIYFLHGYAVDAKFYVDTIGMPEAADNAVAAGAHEAIVVVPDAYTIYNGSMYSNSPVTGDWESFIARDLVAYIDKHYRTLAKRDSRGLAGHSMGGYGTMRIAMRFPEVFRAIYPMSACCLLNQAPDKATVDAQIAVTQVSVAPMPSPRVSDGPLTGPPPTFARATLAQVAAWAPNPKNPPLYFDWPFLNGELQPLVQGKWIANSPLIMVDQHVPALKSFSAIMIDVGDKDGLSATNRQLDAALTRLNVKHTFEVYEGDHTNRVPQRFTESVLPFFSRELKSR
jgi:enterochelin esterase-like enzyme